MGRCLRLNSWIPFLIPAETLGGGGSLSHFVGCENTGFPWRNHLAGLGGVKPQLLWTTLCMTASSIEKRLQWRVLSAVCLKNGHCGLVNRPTIFCGLTNIYFHFPPAIVVPLSCAEFLVERTINCGVPRRRLYLCTASKDLLGNHLRKLINVLRFPSWNQAKMMA